MPRLPGASRNLLLPVAVLASLVLLVTGCGGSSPAPKGTTTVSSASPGTPASTATVSGLESLPVSGVIGQATGVVLRVEGDLTRISSFTLRTDTGEQLQFEIGDLDTTGDAFPAVHLREHQVSAEPITVTFDSDGTTRTALRLADASASPGSPEPSARTATTAPASPLPSGSPAAFDPRAVELRLAPFAQGLRSPVFVTHAGDGSGVLYVLEQAGRIMRLAPDGSVVPDPFLDIASEVSSGGERGLLGLAFHPDYASNGRFFVDYTDRDGNTVVAEFRRSAAGIADPGSERLILHVDQPYANHNGGMLVFGPDGYLYVALGDGGSGGDPHNNAQSRDVLLGKILRIDVDGGLPYDIPRDNPLRDIPGSRGEIWDFGLRNPWRFTFDRETGDLFIGDVGQSTYEEIDAEPARRGGRNYGWRIMEGPECYKGRDCARSGLVPPVAWYGRDDGCSVIGGYVYRGAVSRLLQGAYLFGDFCSGKIWAIAAADALRGAATRTLLLDTGLNVTSFGEDGNGELYLTESGGTIQHLVGQSR